jgi:glycosyltransferase involved in cell wall biosynthesis
MFKTLFSTVRNVSFRVIYLLGLRLKPFLIKTLSESHITKIRALKDKMIHSNNRSVNALNHNLYTNLETGINLVGFVRAEIGIGESCRVAAKALQETDISFGIINFSVGNPARMNDLTCSHKEINKPIYNTNLFIINADLIPLAYTHFGELFFKGHYNIGYWAWELPDFPDEWCDSFNYLHEIWVPSNFVLDSVSRKSTIPVIRIPHAIEVNYPENINRESFNLPQNCFLFLSMYDTHSFQQRKNPEAVIEAFKLAFRENDSSIGLVLKVNNPKTNPGEIERLKEKVKGHKNIYLIDEVLDRDKVNGLINSIDCFISLHRSEGFGLILTEAMYLGKPVIATGWSGNVDFMNNMNSCMVDYKLIQVGNDYGPYKAYQVWSDPDIEHASFFMRKLVSDLKWREIIATKGQETILTNFSPKVVGEMIKYRLVRLGLSN